MKKTITIESIMPSVNIEDFRAKLRDLGINVPAQVLKNWAYTDRVIPAPEPVKHGTGSGIRGRSASWNEEDIPTVAAVWALRHHPIVKYRPILELVPHIKEAARITYETPRAGYYIPAGVMSYEEITVMLKSRPEPLSERLSEDKWQLLLLTWVATIEKAKRGIQIDTPKQVQFNWNVVPDDEHVPGVYHGEPEIVDHNVKDDKHVSLIDSEHDEIVIFIDGDDSRTDIFFALERAGIVDII